MVAHLVVLFFAGAVLLLGGASVVREALILEQTTPALGWKMGYVYLALPISGFFVVLYTVDNLIDTLRERPAGRNSEG
jgi:TRAP-type C4-dicarboxylate transport system permease small subunit